MKFESKFGIGEIVIVGTNIQSRNENGKDYLGEVVCAVFDGSGTDYIVDVQVPTGIQRMQLKESQLDGDPDFDQESGCYPDAS